MARVKKGVTARARHKKIIKLASGYRGRSGNCFRSALPRVQKALKYAYRDRRKRKGDFRSLWIQRINAAVRLNADSESSLHGLTYSRFMDLIRQSGILLNRKTLANMAANSPLAFKEILLRLLVSPPQPISENQVGPPLSLV